MSVFLDSIGIIEGFHCVKKTHPLYKNLRVQYVSSNKNQQSLCLERWEIQIVVLLLNPYTMKKPMEFCAPKSSYFLHILVQYFL
jgi:hypothetical protein